MFRNGAMIFIDQVVGKQRLRTVSAIGETFPMTDTANGKSALVLLDSDTVNRVTKAEAGQSSRHKTQKALRAELNDIGERSYALNIDEHTEGISAAGIAFESGGVVYAISFPAPTNRFLSKQILLVEKLDAIKKQIAVILPGTRFC